MLHFAFSYDLVSLLVKDIRQSVRNRFGCLLVMWCGCLVIHNIHNFIYFLFQLIGILSHFHQFAGEFEFLAVGWSVGLVYEQLVVNCEARGCR